MEHRAINKSKRLRVILMGSFSVWPFYRELGVDQASVRRITSWNETLAFSLARRPELEIHFVTRYRGRFTRQFQRDRLTLTYLATPYWLNAVTLFHWTSWQAQKLIRRLEPDLVHGIGTEHIWPWAAVRSGMPHVITIHGVVSEIARRTEASAFSLLRYFAVLETRVIKGGQNFITISPYVKEWLRTRTKASTYNVENPVHRCILGVNAQPEKSRTILFVGHTGRGKGLGILVEAFGLLKAQGRLDGWKIQVFGPVRDDDYHQKTKAIIQRHGLSERVEFKGFAVPEALAKAYAEAALLVLPSVQETAPMCIAEAMAAGLPVIATRVGGIPYMVADGDSGLLLEVADVPSLAAKLELCIGSPSLRTRMGLAGKAIAIRWHPDQIAEQTEQVYQAVATRSGKAQIPHD